MKMEMSNSEMLIAVDTMSSLEEKGKLGYAIARNLRKLKDEATEYIELRSKLFEKYGEFDSTTGLGMIKPDKIKDYNDELGDIPGIKHEVDIFTVPEDEFYSGSLTSKQMEKMLWMIEEDNKKHGCNRNELGE